MPYQTNGSGFERVDGKVEFDGKIYKYVKRKICDGELILLCLPDEQSKKIETVKSDFFRTTNDVANIHTSKQPVSNSMAAKLLLSIYNTHEEQWSMLSFANHVLYYNPQNTIVHSHCFINTAGEPPEYFI